MSDRRTCHATNRQGRQCGKLAMAGQNVCDLHGGKSPQALASAERRLAADRARQDLAKLGVAIETTPIEALEQMLFEAAGNVAILRQLVAEMPTPLGVNRFAENVVHPLTALYGEERDRLARIAKDCAALGLDERRVRMAEASAERLLGAVTRAIAAAGLMPAQQEAIRRALAGELRALGSAAPPR